MIQFHKDIITEPKARRWTREEYYRMGDAGVFQDQKVELLAGEIFQHHLDREPAPRHWTRAEYYKLADLGLFSDRRVELIGGEIIEMSPQSHSHVTAIEQAIEALRAALGEGFWIRNQAPLRLAGDSEPEPDVSVVAGRRQDYQNHPTTALLVVEISGSTLRQDSTSKAGLYAAVGIADYWIVNLIQFRLDVYRAPVADPGADFAFRYAEVQTYQSGDSIAPLARPDARVAISDLLP